MKENDNIVYYDFEENIMKVGRIKKTYIHKNATDFIKYILNDGSYIEATDYHPIYTNDGWKSYTNRNGYPTPAVGDKVKTNDGWKEIIKIENYFGKEMAEEMGFKQIESSPGGYVFRLKKNR